MHVTFNPFTKTLDQWIVFVHRIPDVFRAAPSFVHAADAINERFMTDDYIADLAAAGLPEVGTYATLWERTMAEILDSANELATRPELRLWSQFSLSRNLHGTYRPDVESYAAFLNKRFHILYSLCAETFAILERDLVPRRPSDLDDLSSRLSSMRL